MLKIVPCSSELLGELSIDLKNSSVILQLKKRFKNIWEAEILREKV